MFQTYPKKRSSEVQTAIQQKLEVEKYRTNRPMSRSEDFIERMLILKSMAPQMREPEIVNILTDHFEALIRDAFRVQKFSMIQGF